MTKIGEEYTLGSINVKTYFRLPIARKGDKFFIVNDGRNSVVNVHDRKLLHSWTLSHPNSFTCPVAGSSEDEAVYCVMNSNTLLKWSLEDDTLKNAAKFKFKESVFAILPACDKQLVVLFSSGKVLLTETLSSSMEVIGESFLRKSEDLIWADTIPLQSGTNVVCLSLSIETNSYKLHSFTITENSISGFFNQTIINGSEALKSWCLNKSTLSFLTIWSSGVILNHQLDNLGQTPLFTVPDVQDLNLLVMDSIDSSHIALLKCNPKQKETFLEIWDIKFSALKAKKELKISSPSFIQLSATDSVLYLSCNEELMEIPFQVEKSTLAAAVGKSTTSVSKIKEFSWDNGKITLVSNKEQYASRCMDTYELEQDILTPTELFAQRLMEEGAAYLSYIPESELVNLLRLAIRYKVKEKDKNINIEPDVLLNAIFSAPLSEVILMNFMEKLNSEEAMVTLEALLSMFDDKSSSSTAKDVTPSDLQLFIWISLVVQSLVQASKHISQDRRCDKLLKKVDKCLSKKITEYEDIECLNHVFSILEKKKNVLLESFVDARYCIETLDV